MNDLISRQAAIDAILHNQEVYSNNFGDDPIDKYTAAIIANDIETIVNLPPAQPERSTEVEDILQFLDDELHPIVSPDDWWIYSELHDMVSGLKRAEPELKKGKWIDKEVIEIKEIQIDQLQSCQCSECGMYETRPFRYYFYEPMFCSYCGADMRGDTNG